MNLVFFGGSFDPPHRGHLGIIRYCQHHFDICILFPAFQTPLKDRFPLENKMHRINMLKLLIKDETNSIKIDNWEIRQSDYSYTYKTINYLKTKYPEAKLSMAIGADQFIQFNQWENYSEIIQSVKIICFNRYNMDFPSSKKINITWLKDFQINVSSSNIREKMFKRETSISDLPEDIILYIQENKLYGYK